MENLVSINILTWNTIKTLNKTLKVLEDISVPRETIIVDQGSIDGCQDLATIKNDENVGISRGKNQGIRASKGKYIVLLDGDVVPVANSINCLIECLEQNEHIKALGLYPNQFVTSEDMAEKYCERITLPVKHDSACLFYGIYRKDVFDEVMLDETGAFGEQGYGWEDRDFYLQMKKAGIEQYVCGINHLSGKYFHQINSSFKLPGNMTHQDYVNTSKMRHKQFKEKWAYA